MNRISLLDYGYVEYVDHCGSDEDIVAAARMSTAKGFRSWEPYFECAECGVWWLTTDDCPCPHPAQDWRKVPRGDVGLLSYLRNHRHTTPFEMGTVIIECQAPIMVYREWHRHRTQCLSGETAVVFDSPRRIRMGEKGADAMTMKELWRKWQPTAGGSLKRRSRIKGMNIRCYDEGERTFTSAHIAEVIYSGNKIAYEVELVDGKRIVCSADHRFLFEGGWATLRNGAGLRDFSGGLAWDEGTEIHVNGEPVYRNREWLESRYHNGVRLAEMAAEAMISESCIRWWLKIHGLQKRGDFPKGNVPWNLGKRYKTGHVVSEEHKAILREARSGPRSNFWRGGSSSERSNISRWTTAQAPRVHAKFNYVCQLCGKRGGPLHTHHVIPVWADISRAYDFDNLASLCTKCHRKVQCKELDFVPALTGSPTPAALVGRKPPAPRGRPLAAKLVGIKNIRCVGSIECYDLSIEGPHHNFVANGIITHNSYNEMSARYTPLPDVNYVPTVERLLLSSKTNKQAGVAKGAEELSEDVAKDYRLRLDYMWHLQQEFYQWALKKGVPKELARVHIGVGRYSRMRASANLKNWLDFMTLRSDFTGQGKGAQWEIRQYANAVGALIAELFPRTWSLFVEGNDVRPSLRPPG